MSVDAGDEYCDVWDETVHRARKELAADLAEAGWGPPGAGRNPHRKAFVGRAGG